MNERQPEHYITRENLVVKNMRWRDLRQRKKKIHGENKETLQQIFEKC